MWKVLNHLIEKAKTERKILNAYIICVARSPGLIETVPIVKVSFPLFKNGKSILLQESNILHMPHIGRKWSAFIEKSRKSVMSERNSSKPCLAKLETCSSASQSYISTLGVTLKPPLV